MDASSSPIGRHADRLVVMTRYPEPGTVKSRLVPVLGAEGAASLQRDMTARILRAARVLRSRTGIGVTVRFAGGSAALMRRAFGRDLAFRPQAAGDLGDRIRAAVEAELAVGARRVVVVGADCPRLDAERLSDSFDRLESAPFVVGPAVDGGYYLIGLRADADPGSLSAVTTRVPWGTSAVFARTVAVLNGLGITPAVLEELSDVDRPEDLPEWESVAGSRSVPRG
jgi:uncharacterized protein